MKTRARNEALDLAVLYLDAYTKLNVNFDRVQQSLEEVREPETEKPKFHQGVMKTKSSWAKMYR